VTAASPAESLAWESITAGDQLPEMVLVVTATRIVAGAIATRDFMPVHHDRAYANSQGAPEIFMNILSDTGYCSRFLTDWAGPEAVITRLAIRLGVPLFAGSTLTYTGSVIATHRSDGEGIVEVDLRAAVDMGDHLTGTATLRLPVGGAPAG
jgi:acyl dehydratase